jgi:hypothetical protein
MGAVKAPATARKRPVIRSAKEAIRILSNSRRSRIARAPDFIVVDRIAQRR